MAMQKRLTPERARTRRELQGSSLRQIAARSGVPFNRIHLWEGGAANLSAVEVEAIRAALEATVSRPLTPFAKALTRVIGSSRMVTRHLAMARVVAEDLCVDLDSLASEHRNWLGRLDELALATRAMREGDVTP